MKITKTLVIGAAVFTALASPTAAIALGGSENLGTTGIAYVVSSPDTTSNLGGTCKYVREAAGIGGGGITYHVVGEGTAGGAYNGIPIVATGVRCRFFLGSSTYVSGPEYLPGGFAETNVDVTSNNAAGGNVCVTVYAVLRQTPPGGTSNTIATPETC